MSEIEQLDTWLDHRNRDENTVADTLVLHATATGTLEEALDILRLRGISYHAIVDHDGSSVQCVPFDRVAYHAGKSFGPQGENVNEYSVGLSMVNWNDGDEPYPEEQVSGLVELALAAKEAVPTLKYVTTHAAVAPKRKTDPVGFDLEGFAKRVGLEVWLGAP